MTSTEVKIVRLLYRLIKHLWHYSDNEDELRSLSSLMGDIEIEFDESVWGEL
jgi:hypothetical protein